MTPPSTGRIHNHSPLDIFGATAHLSPPAVDAGHAFEAELKKVTWVSKASSHRQPVRPSPVAAREHESNAPQETPEAREDSSASTKQHSKVGQANGPVPKCGDDESCDEPDRDAIADQPTSDVSPTPPPSTVADNQGESAVAGKEPEETPSEQVESVHVDLAPPGWPVAGLDPEMESAATAKPDPTANEPTVTDPSGDLVSSGDQPSTISELAIQANELGVIAETEIQGTGQTSPLTEEPKVLDVVDPIAAIDNQTAAGTLEIQPRDVGGNADDQQGDSNANDGQSEHPADALSSTPPFPGVPMGQGAQNQDAEAVAPSTTSDGLPPSKDVPLSSTSNSPQTAGVQSNPSRLPQHVLARTENHHGHNPAPVPIDSARFLSRVAKAFLSAQQREGNEVRLRLSPPELGSLRLQVSVQDGVMVARMETETEAARSSLVNNLPALRERLAEQGIRVERFDIDLMQRPSTGTPDRPSDPQHQQESFPLRPLRTQQPIAESPIVAALGNHWNGQGRLNVII